MAPLRADQKVGVIGAGTMGAGIAQIAGFLGRKDRCRVSPLLRRKMFSGSRFL